MKVSPKKHLGQHFLTNQGICQRIVDAIPVFENKIPILEIGPGKGAITSLLLGRKDLDLYAFEIDLESIQYLNITYPDFQKVYLIDFLKADLTEHFFHSPFCVVGNFPYNISSQILFKCLEYRQQIPLIVGMFQKEVAKRIAEPPGSKEYGILSVLMQTFYTVEYLFSIEPGSFYPPPKVNSGVIRCVRNNRSSLDCDEKLFFTVVKMAFNQRRKTIKNALKAILNEVEVPEELASKRAEQLSVEAYISLTKVIEKDAEKKG
jgi:16S rRNA (adenine1518-N6/adenine1519-N6)-dimethyltransferase